MIVFYSSPLGNTKRLVKNIELPAIQIPFRYGRDDSSELLIECPYVLICPTYKTTRNTFVPDAVKQFLLDNDNYKQMRGVIGTGNRNFGTEFCLTAKLIANKFSIPILGEVELSGYPGEEKILREKILSIIPMS